MSAPEISPPAPAGGGTPIGGSGTTGKLAKFTATSTIGDSVITEASGLVGVGCTDPGNTLETYASTASGIRASSDTLANIGIFQYSGTATGASLTLRKSGGTRATPSAVTSGDTIGTVQFSAYGTGGNVVSSIASSVVAYTSATNISSNLTFGTSPSGSAAAVTRMTLNSSGAMIMAGDGTAAAPIIANSTGVSGLYFPSAATAAIAANGAVAATFSKVAGAGVTLGGTTGLIFDASGTQQGVKLTATPDNTNANTIDCYVDGGASAGGVSWTPTLSAAGTWGGTAPTVTNARYTRIGNMVFCTVTLDATASTAFSSTYGSSTITAPAGVSAAVFTSVPSNRAAVSANGAQSGTTIFVPTYASSTNVINITWFYAV
jgi:hypothetical protein